MKNWKKVVSLGLAFIMALSVSACGGTDKEQDRAEMDAVKQGVYKSQDIYLTQQSENGDVSYATVGYVNDRLCFVEIANSYGTDEEGMWYSKTEYALKSMKLDGSDVISVPMEGMEGVSENMNTNAYTYFNNLQINANGVFGIMNYEDYNQIDENGNAYREISLIGWDMNGKQIFKTQLNTQESSGGWYYTDVFMPLSDGRLLIVDNNQTLSIYDKQGNLTKNLKVEGMDMMGGMFLGKGDTLYVMVWTEDYMTRTLHVFDTETGKLGEAIEIPFSLSNFTFLNSSKHDMLLSRHNGGLYYYDFEAGLTEPVEMMNFINSDFEGTGLNFFVEISDTQFAASYYSSLDYLSRIAVFNKVDPADIPDKKPMTIACYWMNNNLKKRVIEFNKNSELYRISILDYSQYSTDADYMAGYTRLNNDILAGKIPDIMVLSQDMPIESYISKGLFADIYEFIDNDPELNREDYFENVFEAFSRDGELYCIVPSFSVNTVIAKQSDVGNVKGWTMEEAIKILKSKPEGTAMFSYDENRHSIGYTLINNCLAQYVDRNTGLCNFNSQSFKDVLRFVASLPEEANINYDDPEIWNKYDSQYRDGTTLASQQSLYGFDSLVYYFHGMFGEPIAYVGYPTEDRNGSSIMADEQYAITTKAEKEGAWEFLRYYLTEEAQKEVYNFPLIKDLWWEKSKVATEKPTWTDENGVVHEEEHTYWMNGETIILDPLSQEELQALYDFVCSVNKVQFYDDAITNIIQEEVESFYSGAKGVDEVADIIQNRVQLYVDENR